MKITVACASYFDAFEKISNCKKNDCSQNLLALAKLVSYCTLIIPLAVGIIYACASLYGRVTSSPSPQRDPSFLCAQLFNYFSHLHQKFPQLFLYQYYTGKNRATIDISEIKDRVLKDLNPKTRYTKKNEKIDLLAYPLHIEGNHWTLVVVDTKKRRVEYYDSKVLYGDALSIRTHLLELRDELNQRYPGSPSYELHMKIKKELQPDSIQCGPWILYFLEKRLEDPNVNFNDLDPVASESMIEEFRKQVLTTIGS